MTDKTDEIDVGHFGRKYIPRAVVGLVFLCPIVAVTVDHASGIIVGLLFILGLFYGLDEWRNLHIKEKQSLITFVLFVIFISVSLINTDDFKEASHEL